jgi:UPF0755 protein
MNENKNYIGIAVFGLILIGFILYGLVQTFSVPNNFPVGKNFVINENESLKSISNRLKEEGYINSPLFFRAAISFFDKDRTIQLGGYIFNNPSTLLGIIDTFVRGKPNSPLLSVTIPEGSTSFEVATLVSKALPTISVDVFGEMISKYNADGKLFPSTYFLLPSYKEEDIVKLMMNTFTKKVESTMALSQVVLPLKNENDALTLASILEGEAKTKEDMAIVSGILLTRMKLGMPLQVDVAKETYKQKGLPRMPLNNPGLVAIDAAIHPKYTEYLYYITGNEGGMHYAKTFEEHKKNIKKYLK